MKRAMIRIHGRVQKAGFRDTVDELAYHLGLVGYVKNLEDGSVEVVCEGDEANIAKLVEKLNIKQYPIRVDDITIEYSEPRGEHADFVIIREEDLTVATYERMDLAARYMREMNHDLGNKMDTGFKELGTKVDAVGTKVDAVGTKVDAVGTKLDEIHVDLTEKMETNTDETRLFREETRGAFVELDTKYHVVSEALLSMNDSLKITEAKMIESVDNLTRVVEEFLSARKSK